MLGSPEDSVQQFTLKDGAIVADLGVGSGHYVYALSHAVGESGKVFAVDIRKEMLERLKKEVDEKGIKNVEIIWGDVEIVGGTKLRAGSLDAVVVSNVLFQLDAKAGLVHECARILKTGGKVMLIDWSESFGGLGPQPNAVVSEDMARRIFETGPFQYRNSINAGEHHYGLIFDKKAS